MSNTIIEGLLISICRKLEQPNADALERLAHATMNNGHSPASPRQALIGCWMLRSIQSLILSSSHQPGPHSLKLGKPTATIFTARINVSLCCLGRRLLLSPHGPELGGLARLSPLLLEDSGQAPRDAVLRVPA